MLSTNFFVARRYFSARRRQSVVNIISRISLVGIAVCTFALVVVLSVYNGIGRLTQNLFNVFDPELIVEPSEGKSFIIPQASLHNLFSIDGIDNVSQIVEEKAWVTCSQRQAIVQLRGVEASYAALSGLDSLIYEGTWIFPLTNQTIPSVVLGSQIYYSLGLSPISNSPIAISIPKRTSSLGFSLQDAFNTVYAFPSGCFYVQQDIDSRFAVIDINSARRLLDYDSDVVTALSVKLVPGADAESVKGSIIQQLSSDNVFVEMNPHLTVTVKDRFEQQPLYYKIFHSERLAIYLILALITFISTFTLVASLALLIIEKRSDTLVLLSMGMQIKDIRAIFFLQGLLITAVGSLLGLFAGFLLCHLQQHYGLVSMGDNFVTNTFPVAMRFRDFVASFVLVLSIGAFSVWFSVRHLVK